MSYVNLPQTLSEFQDQRCCSSLQLTFGVHKVLNYLNGGLIHKAFKKDSRVLLHKAQPAHLTQMEVVDSLVFQFSFLFEAKRLVTDPKAQNIQLPKPLVDALLRIRPQQLELSFRIDAPDPSVRVHVRHIYSGPLGIERLNGLVPT